MKKKKDFTQGSVRVFFSYYAPHRKLLLLDLAMAVFAVAAELVFPYATRYALNRLLPNGLYKAFFLLIEPTGFFFIQQLVVTVLQPIFIGNGQRMAQLFFQQRDKGHIVKA